MADPAIVDIVRQYLRNLAQHGILARMGVIFGSYAAGHPHQWSDIDLVVVSPAFDGTFSRDAINSLWRVAARTDSRIEPIPCGERQWAEDTATPIIEIARREGIQVTPDGNSKNEMT
ncbi:MAG: nucleotidyltransferase domain-containing protein [Sedimentisphaerales bacterium]|nr:nucleotidyltransferase domain-containing protein [Sedimentisphaerales bacterium]